jgi:hypothetical protein
MRYEHRFDGIRGDLVERRGPAPIQKSPDYFWNIRWKSSANRELILDNGAATQHMLPRIS